MSMKGLISIVCGLVSFSIISVAQMYAYRDSMLYRTTSELTDISIDWKFKLISIAIALLSIAYSISYTKSGKQKMGIVNRVGRYLAILAILLCIIPLYQVFVN